MCVSNDTVARIGGDEFLFVASGLHTSDNAAFVAMKIIQCLSQPIVVKEDWVRVGASIGIALYPANSHDPKELVNQADKAMYAAKNAGKNQYVFA